MNKIYGFLSLLAVLFLGCTQKESAAQNKDTSLTLWYESPAIKWVDAFPMGNGRLAAMNFGGTDVERFQLNEESLWAGVPSNPYADDYLGKFKKIQELLLAGKNIEANTYGLENMVAGPASFRSYEPLADLLIKFNASDSVSNYKRTLDLATGISKITYRIGDSEIVRESFISAVDDVICIKLTSKGENKINCSISLDRKKDVKITASPEGKLYLDGQIVDVEAPEAYDDNAGGSGEGGKHMSFAGELQTKIFGGNMTASENNLVIENVEEIVILFTAATDYNLSKLNFDTSINPKAKVTDILNKVQEKSWQELKEAHVKEHAAIFNRVSLDLGKSANDSLPTDKRLLAYKNGAKDSGLEAQLFQFGRYLLMGSSRSPGILPANLQGKWSERMWAPWEADYHLNVNLQMNYWPADVTNISETTNSLINWFELITETGKPLAKEMYGANGWFSHHATNPFGRVTPSASTLPSQFNNGVLDVLPGAWMVMSLWDHYEYTQDKVFLQERLYPMLSGASEFILDVLVSDAQGTLHFAPSASPENMYMDVASGEMLRITASSTYHVSIINAVFKATQEAASILNIQDDVTKRIEIAKTKLPHILIDDNGRIMEWRNDVEEKEAGHRHLSHLLGVHPFSLITPETPELFEAAKKTLAWREANGHGGMGWAHAHALLMHARMLESEKAYQSLNTLLTRGRKSSLMNTIGPFQIDGNLGATAGVAEMLIQSHLKNENGDFIIHLLPAIPTEWSHGKVTGLRVRGGFEVDMEWDKERLKVNIISEKGGACSLQAKGKTEKVILRAGEKRAFIF
ncbi:MAG: glycoside hydrolase family 95 protein [Algibacter sp.]